MEEHQLQENSVCVSLANIGLKCSFRYTDTEHYLREYTYQSSDDGWQPDNVISVTEQEFSDWEKAGNVIDAFAEFCLSCMPISEALLEFNCCVFHAAAVRYRDRAWLLAGGSGVGKTTQCRGLLSADSNCITVINGDKPVLECLEDGSVMVHPSPWNGKEGLQGAAKARLAGIFMMMIGSENRLEELTKDKAGPLVFSSVFHSFRDTHVIKKAAEISEKITRSVPVRVMVCHDRQVGTRMLYECIKNGGRVL